MYTLEAINLTKKYNTVTALDNLNLAIKPGEVFCILGQNGAGKTTTLNLFLGFIQPTSGTANVKGVSISDPSTSRKSLAYIPEVVMLYRELSGIENLDYFSRLAGHRYSTDELHELLTRAGLQREAHEQRIAGYSKGMRQKVGIAIALGKNADAILMDEPTSGLDPKATVEFTAAVKRLASEGHSVLMATHDIFNAVNCASRIGIMVKGSLVHIVEAQKISAHELQKLYMETIGEEFQPVL